MFKQIEHNAVKIIYIILLTLGVLYLISPFAASIMFGGTIALSLFPLLMKLESKGMGRKRGAMLLTVAFAFMVSIPFSFFVVRGTFALTDQLVKFNQDVGPTHGGVASILSKAKEDLVNGVRGVAHKFGAENYFDDERVDSFLVQGNSYLIKFFQATASALPNYFLYFLIMLLCIYSFLAQASGVRTFFQRLFGLTDERMDKLVMIYITDSRSVYVTNIVTAAVQSVCVAIGVYFLGIGDFFLTFFVTLILAFIPVIGAAPVAFVYGAVAYFQGNLSGAIIISVVGVFSGLIDNILRPYLATMGESRIPALVAFVCVLGGALLFGFPGLFIGLLLGTFAYDTIPFFWDELNQNLDADKEIFILKSQTPEEPLERH